MGQQGQTSTTRVLPDPFAQQSGQNLFNAATGYLNQFGDQQIAGQQPFTQAAQSLLGMGLLGYNPGFRTPQYGPGPTFLTGDQGLGGYSQTFTPLGGENAGFFGKLFPHGGGGGGDGGGSSAAGSLLVPGLMPATGSALGAAQDIATGVGQYQTGQVQVPSVGVQLPGGPAQIPTNFGAPQVQAPAAQGAPQVQAPGNVGFQQISPSTFLGGLQPQMDEIQAPGIGAYQNPYTEQVVGTTLADIDRARQLANTQGARSSGASTFGGDRNALIEAETNRAYGDIAARQVSQLRSQGFDAAAGLLGQDLQRGLQAQLANQGASVQTGLANQGAGLTAALANQGVGAQFGLANAQAALQAALANQGAAVQTGGFNLQAALANQAAQQQAGQFGAGLTFDQQRLNALNQLQAQQFNQQAGLAGAGLNLDAAGVLAGLGGQQFSQLLQGANALNQFGLQNQGLAQQYISQPLNNISYLNSLLQGVPFGGTTQYQTLPPGSQAAGVAGGLLSGAGTGAMIGSVIPGLGTALGAGIGGVLGGLGGWLG